MSPNQVPEWVMKLALIALLAAVPAVPTGACADHLVPGFLGHRFGSSVDAHSARRTAIEQARRALIARLNLSVGEDRPLDKAAATDMRPSGEAGSGRAPARLRAAP
jgi:hypothetical protein